MDRKPLDRKPGFRTVTVYMDPLLYERVKHAAAALNEHAYAFVTEAVTDAITRRIPNRATREAIDAMSMIRIRVKEKASNGKRR